MNYRYSTVIPNYRECVKLDLNESNDVHHPGLCHELTQALSSPKTITHYSNMYGDATTQLLAHISNYNKIEQHNIMLTAGSDVGLEYLVKHLVTPTTTVYIFVPTYSYFNSLVVSQNAGAGAGAAGASGVIYIPFDIYENDYDVNKYLEKYLEKNATNNANAVVYIVNPNNPTGILFNQATIEQAFINYPNVTFIIDEAYIEYCFAHSSVKYCAAYSNVYITRTFSKAYGLAGLRLGYIISHPTNILGLHAYFNEASLTELSKVAANFIYKNIDYYEQAIVRLKQRRDDFTAFLEKHSICSLQSNANFISLYIGSESEQFIELLKSQQHIYIRSKTNDVNMKGFVRISIGSETSMTKIKNFILAQHNGAS